MDVPRIDHSTTRFRPALWAILPTVAIHATLLAGWIVALCLDQPPGPDGFSIPWELGLVLYWTWTSGWRFGVAAAVLAAVVRWTFLPTLVGIDANLWVVQAGSIWWVNRLRARYRDAQQRALRDPLTDLPNRRALDEFLRAELSRARRFERPIVVAVLDCDGFKQLNDKSGHAAGDEALLRIGRLLRNELRHYDGVFRLGGDEFVMVLPETDQNGAEHAFERLRAAFAHEVERQFPGLTASLGVAIFPVAPPDVTECLAHADETMYRAKRRGPGETAFAVIPPPDSARIKPPRVLIVE